MEFARYCSYLLLISISLCCIPRSTSASCAGCVDLDEITFDKLLPRFPYALIKFDIAFPYGEKHEAFGQFALKAHQVTNDLLIGLVGIKDYGEKENSALGTRFNVEAEAYPAIFLFRGPGLDDYVRFPKDADISVSNLKEFVTENSDLYIGLDGCLKEFNDIVVDFSEKNEAEQHDLIQLALQKLDKVTDDTQRASAKVYVAFMRRIAERGPEFVKEENARLAKLKAGKVSDSKRVELSHKLNILQSFKSRRNWAKSEL